MRLCASIKRFVVKVRFGIPEEIQTGGTDAVSALRRCSVVDDSLDGAADNGGGVNGASAGVRTERLESLESVNGEGHGENASDHPLTPQKHKHRHRIRPIQYFQTVASVLSHHAVSNLHVAHDDLPRAQHLAFRCDVPCCGSACPALDLDAFPGLTVLRAMGGAGSAVHLQHLPRAACASNELLLGLTELPNRLDPRRRILQTVPVPIRPLAPFVGYASCLLPDSLTG